MEENKKIRWENIEGKIKLSTFSITSERKIQKHDWNPFTSKLAAGLFNGLEIFPFTLNSNIFMIDEFSTNTLTHLQNIVDSSNKIQFFNSFKINPEIEQVKKKINSFDIIYFDLKSNNSILKIIDFEKILKKSGFFIIILNSSKHEISSSKELSNWWDKKSEKEKLNIFQNMGIPLNNSDMKMMLSSNFIDFSKIWQDNISLNLTKENISYVGKQIEFIINNEKTSLKLIEEVNLLNFFDSTLLIFQKNYENPS